MNEFLKILGIIVLTVAIVIGGIFTYRWLIDFGRETTMHSQAYVQSTIQQLNEIITAYTDPDASQGQKAALIDQFCYKITLLIPEERPSNLLAFQSAHC